MKKEYNTNCNVYFKLNDRGLIILKNYFYRVKSLKENASNFKEIFPQPDKDGFYVLPFIEFMKVFGKYVDNVNDMPFNVMLRFESFDLQNIDDRPARKRRNS